VIRALPRSDLHVRLDGSLRLETLIELGGAFALLTMGWSESNFQSPVVPGLVGYGYPWAVTLGRAGRRGPGRAEPAAGDPGGVRKRQALLPGLRARRGFPQRRARVRDRRVNGDAAVTRRGC
jgi:hypothetical protein